ncbi:MAG TPA: hypothetical protein VD927_06280 [Chryseosolibacter sp.]|nr:hypothetical protein [Chryseosolibacter sp.]
MYYTPTHTKMEFGNAKVTGTIGVDDNDLLLAVKKWAGRNKSNGTALGKMIIDFFQDERGMKVLRVQRSENGGMMAEVDLDFKTAYELASKSKGKISNSIKLHGTPKKEKIKRSSNEGFTRSNKGFYSYVAEIIEEYKGNGKSHITFEELHDALMSVPDEKGKPKFEKEGEPIEIGRVKQYLTPSQIARNPIVKGLKRDKEGRGLVF